MIEYKTKKKIVEETGLSLKMIDKMLDSGEISFSKNGKSQSSGVMIYVPSFNKYFKKRSVIKP